MGDWIYETPDGGKTVTRRPSRSIDDMSKEMEIIKDAWMDLRTLRKIGKQHYREKMLREQNPQLMELWESYQTMLRLLSDRDRDRDDDT
jgi:hypothetical protein